MRVSELIKELQKQNPEAEVWLPNVNELGIPGYCVLDQIMSFKFGQVESDVFDNPGEIDIRLLKGKNEDDPIVYLGSIYEFMKGDSPRTDNSQT